GRPLPRSSRKAEVGCGPGPARPSAGPARAGSPLKREAPPVDARERRPRVVRGVSVLQGTFETLALPELLGMLAGARKSGALRLEAGPVSAVVYLQDGHCRAVE